MEKVPKELVKKPREDALVPESIVEQSLLKEEKEPTPRMPGLTMGKEVVPREPEPKIDKPPHQLTWEKIAICHGASVTWRLKVPGGWLVKVIAISKNAMNCFFIEDKEHEWKMEAKDANS